MAFAQVCKKCGESWFCECNGNNILAEQRRKWFGEKDRNVAYGSCPGFDIFVGDSCISGHMVIKESDTKEDIGFKMIEMIVRHCKERGASLEVTLENINSNLRINNLLNEKK